MRLRLTYSRNQSLRYAGNLDMHKLWERALRRARLPLAYSQGFHPQPRLNQALPLPLGLTSRCEMIDIWLDGDLDLKTLLQSIQTALPDGMDVLKVQPIDPRAPALPTTVRAADYKATLLDSVPEPSLQERITTLLDAASLPRERRGKTYDLRPLVEDLRALPADNLGRERLSFRLKATSGATGRPDEVLLALDLDPTAARVERTGLSFLDNPAQAFILGSTNQPE